MNRRASTREFVRCTSPALISRDSIRDVAVRSNLVSCASCVKVTDGLSRISRSTRISYTDRPNRVSKMRPALLIPSSATEAS